MDGPVFGDDTTIAITVDEDIVLARQASRVLGARAGCSSTELTEVATAISEIARNILRYAGGGEIRLRLIESADAQGIEMTATDRGPGIVDVRRAMQDGYTTAGGLGLGLPGAQRLVDTFSIASTVGEGTTVVMRKWVTEPVAVLDPHGRVA